MDVDYTVTTDKTFDDAVEAVVQETENANFRVLYIHNVQETLAKKGFSTEPLKIIEICNAKNAYSLLQKDVKLSLFLPCKINVYVKDGNTVISALRPQFIQEIYQKTDIVELIKEVEEMIELIVNNAK